MHELQQKLVYGICNEIRTLENSYIDILHVMRVDIDQYMTYRGLVYFRRVHVNNLALRLFGKIYAKLCSAACKRRKESYIVLFITYTLTVACFFVKKNIHFDK